MKFNKLFLFIIGVFVSNLIFNFITGKFEWSIFFLLTLGAILGYQIGKNEVKNK
ncbi:D-alanyl-D-alanine carboxypeptidase [Bacillus toyonensis]|nr:D-alanyl-D-alanine carboxypeptidase [Bacillus toyonensis]MDF9451748.1 D-alanyl-D-alanine carboxypeptidase [Bacillus toyonensis]MDG1564897.1 D-alanyl-D-alanine carboxypeptidase [Bacillus toyonensis]PEO54816.1 D-alanyl-D-alanine carboxypeptidase [Bacillus toyonensis]PFX70598.1 D-alanyl-D-alanine carboxypeptidase [Bacillus toyonensis]PFX72229.1 D-alanyl-D-alanine carboxypeptidase [Bacillus toyonensis]